MIVLNDGRDFGKHIERNGYDRRHGTSVDAVGGKI